jgi:hypothetical protein
MKRILRRRPSPAVAVSFVALFVALGGSAYALTITGANIKTNSVTGTDLRDIKGGDIRNYSIRGKDIGKDSLGRVPIKEERLDASKFGKVKNAADADSLAGVTSRRFGAFTLDTGGSRELLRQGPLVLSARCRVVGADQVADVIVQTTQNGAAVDGIQNDPQLNVGESVEFARASAPVGTPAFEQAGDGTAIAQDGTEILGQEFYTGTSVIGQGNKCRFGGVIYIG